MRSLTSFGIDFEIPSAGGAIKASYVNKYWYGSGSERAACCAQRSSFRWCLQRPTFAVTSLPSFFSRLFVFIQRAPEKLLRKRDMSLLHADYIGWRKIASRDCGCGGPSSVRLRHRRDVVEAPNFKLGATTSSMYTVGRPLSHDVLLCFMSAGLVTNRATQYSRNRILWLPPCDKNQIIWLFVNLDSGFW